MPSFQPVDREEAAHRVLRVPENVQPDVQVKVKTEYEQSGPSAVQKGSQATDARAMVNSSNKDTERNNLVEVKKEWVHEQESSTPPQNGHLCNRGPIPAPALPNEKCHIKYEHGSERDQETICEPDVSMNEEVEKVERVAKEIDLVDLTSDVPGETSKLLMGIKEEKHSSKSTHICSKNDAIAQGGPEKVTGKENIYLLSNESKRPDVKLIKLTPDQAKDCSFPHGCQIMYESNYDEASSTTSVRLGVVKSVNVSLRGDFMYEIDVGHMKEQKDDHILMVDEKSLAYAPTAPVFYQPGQSCKIEGTILLASRTDAEFQYSVLTTSMIGGHTIQHNVTPEQLSHRPVKAAEGDDKSIKASLAASQLTYTTEGNSTVASPRSNKGDADAAPQKKVKEVVASNRSNNEEDKEETTVLEDTEDAEMLSILEGLGQIEKHECPRIAAKNQASQSKVENEATNVKSSKKRKRHSKESPATGGSSARNAEQAKSGPKWKKSCRKNRPDESTSSQSNRNRSNKPFPMRQGRNPFPLNQRGGNHGAKKQRGGNHGVEHQHGSNGGRENAFACQNSEARQQSAQKSNHIRF